MELHVVYLLTSFKEILVIHDQDKHLFLLLVTMSAEQDL